MKKAMTTSEMYIKLEQWAQSNPQIEWLSDWCVELQNKIEKLESQQHELHLWMEKLDSTGSAPTAKMSAAVKEVPTVLPQADTESQMPTMAESVPPPSPSPSELSSTSRDLGGMLLSKTEGQPFKTPVQQWAVNCFGNHASTSYSKPIVKPKSGA
jgi:hypothetical protein